MTRTSAEQRRVEAASPARHLNQGSAIARMQAGPGGAIVPSEVARMSRRERVVGQTLKRSAVFVAMGVALVLAGRAAPSTPAPHIADQATAYQLDATHDGFIA